MLSGFVFTLNLLIEIAVSEGNGAPKYRYGLKYCTSTGGVIVNDSLRGQIERAYKKLKSSVYYDRTQLALRNNIVAYEADHNLEDRFIEIEEILSGDNSGWTDYLDGLLKSIEALTFPKKLVKSKRTGRLIVNDSPKTIEIDDPQYFIHMDVEGQILGILWILYLGIDIDKSIYEHSYGNRLKKTIVNENKEITSFSPYLFKPYYRQYESWRDIGLKHAQDCLDNHQDVLILTLDVTRFFYSVNFNPRLFNDIYIEYTKRNGVNQLVQRLNNFVFKVLETYSRLFGEFEDRVFLPIGFYPSNILSNWYLDPLDRGITNRLNPLYYGRYVDDIIIVEKIEQNSLLREMVQQENTTEEEILDFLFAKTDQDKKGRQDTTALFVKNKEQYRINPKFNRDKKADILVETSKVKIFYFNHQNSSSLLTCFRNEIRKNSSEFRFLPEDGQVFRKNDYSEIYDLENSATINKLRGVKGVSIDKFAFSKFLGKNLAIGNLINDKLETDFEKDLDKIFTNLVIIDNYGTWERVLIYLIINGRYETYRKFVKRIIDAIEASVYSKEINNSDRIKSISESLHMVLYAGIAKSLSHVWGSHVRDHISELIQTTGKYDQPDILMYRHNYCHARMCDKYIMPAMIDAYFARQDDIFDDSKSINLTQVTDALKYIHIIDRMQVAYRFYPYMISPQDIMMTLTLGKIADDITIKNSPTSNDNMNKLFFKLNYDHPNGDKTIEDICVKEFNYADIENVRETYLIKVGQRKKLKFKIAVANAHLYDQYVLGALIDAPIRTLERYSKLSTIINCALENGTDILILPESYVPVEWIPALARVCARNQMALITGIEHVKVGTSVYNLTATILPYESEDYRYSYINFHNKVFYAPHEKRLINGYQLTEIQGNSYDLFVWNDLWFSTYCCYELTSIIDRSLFMSYVDMMAIVEWNRDVNYYSGIIDTLSRDIHCYCVQVNCSDYGDSRITMPAKTEIKDILKTKGGINETVLIGEIDVARLRLFQLKGYELQKDDPRFKPTPPQFNRDIVKKKIKGTLWNEIT